MSARGCAYACGKFLGAVFLKFFKKFVHKTFLKNTAPKTNKTQPPQSCVKDTALAVSDTAQSLRLRYSCVEAVSTQLKVCVRHTRRLCTEVFKNQTKPPNKTRCLISVPKSAGYLTQSVTQSGCVRCSLGCSLGYV